MRRAPKTVSAELAIGHGLPVPVVDTPCVNHPGYREKRGYGVQEVHGKPVKAHRVAWERVHGPIPVGLQIDHLCRNPACVNVDHLEATTSRINTLRGMSQWGVNARKTHCIHGHEFTPQNTYIKGGAKRRCRECHRAEDRRRYARRTETPK